MGQPAIQTFVGNGTWVCPGGVFFAKVRSNKFTLIGDTADRGFIDANGRLFGMGLNTNGQLGDGTVTVRSSPVLVIGGLSFKRAIIASSANSWGITTSGVMYGWGINAGGQVGDGSQTPRSSPVLVAGGLTFQDFQSGATNSSSCWGLTANGLLYSWGSNSSGELGDGTSAAKSSPVLVVGGITFAKVKASGAGSTNSPFVVGLDTSGNLWSWGDNTSGQLGDGTSTKRSSPVQVVGGLTFKDFAILSNDANAAGNVTGGVVAVTTAGVLYSWGANTAGQLGDGTTTKRSSPVQVLGGLTWARVFDNKSAGFNSLAMTTDGKLYIWGGGTVNGDGTNTAKSSPVLVLGGLSFNKVFVSVNNTVTSTIGAVVYGITYDGTLYAWGNGAVSGQIGDGSNSQRSSPAQVVGGLKWKHVWSTSTFNGNTGATIYGLTIDGRLYSWGGSTNGELGDGTSAAKSSPVLVLGGLSGNPVDATQSFTVPVVPGTTYNVTFGAGAVSFSGVPVGGPQTDSVTVEWEQ